MAEYIVENGVISTGVELNGGDRMYVKGGGTAAGTVLAGDASDSAVLTVSAGGAANTTIISSAGVVTISGMATSTTVNLGGILTAAQDGLVDGITVLQGAVNVLENGSARNAMLKQSGTLTVSSGGRATNITAASSGTLMVSGGIAENADISGTGVMTVLAGGTAATVSDGSFLIHSGGALTASGANTLVVSASATQSGTITVGDSAQTDSVLVANQGSMTVHSQGAASLTTVGGYGKFIVSAGGTATSTTVNWWGEMAVESAQVTSVAVSGGTVEAFAGGVVKSAVIGNIGTLLLHSGGSAVEAAVSGGSMHISSGAAADGTTLKTYGLIAVSGGGSATDTILSAGSMYLESDAEAVGATVSSGAALRVRSGGRLNDGVIASGGVLELESGAVGANLAATSGAMLNGFTLKEAANYGNLAADFKISNAEIVSGRDAVLYAGQSAVNVTAVSGFLNVSSGAVANVVSVTRGSMAVLAGGSAGNGRIESQGFLEVSSGGAVSGAAVLGSATVYSGGRTDNLKISAGKMTVSAGGTADRTKVSSGGTVSFAGSGSGTVISAGGTATIAGGTLSATTVLSDAALLLQSGAATGLTLASGGTAVISGGAASSIQLAGAELTLISGGSADDVVTDWAGNIMVSEGGRLNSAVIAQNVVLTVYQGGSASATVLDQLGNVIVSRGGTASLVEVRSYGSMTVCSGGYADGIMLYESGALTLKKGAATGDITLNENVDFTLGSGAAATGITIMQGAALTVVSGGSAAGIMETGGLVTLEAGAQAAFAAHTFSGLTLSAGQTATVHSGTVARATTLQSGAVLALFEGGVGSGTTLNDGGVMTLSGGTAIDAEVRSGGRILLSSGAVLTGVLQLAGGAEVTAEDGSEVVFTVAGRTEEGDYLVNDLSRIVGAPSYTILTEQEQSKGEYKLARNAGSIPQNLTVCEEHGECHAITVNGAEVIAGQHAYSLLLSDANDLTLKVRGLLATPQVNASTDKPTNQDVILTASYDPKTVSKLYSVDGGSWRNYTASLKVGENGIYRFKGVDSDGFESGIVTYEVKNINKVPPAAPTVTADITKPTNQDVTLTAKYSDSSVVKQFSTDGTTWSSYTSSIKATANGTWYFRGKDEAGNISQTTQYTVSNIDKVAPDAPTVSITPTAVTGRSVTVTAAFGAGTTVRQYSSDNKNWSAYTAPLSVGANGTWYFRGKDEAGNISGVTACKISNISGDIIVDGKKLSGKIGSEGIFSKDYTVDLDYAGLYTVGGDFGTLQGKVAILNGKKKVAAGTIKNGVLTFNKGKAVPLDSTTGYTLELTNTDKGKTASSYSFTVKSTALFTKADPSHGSWEAARTLGTVAAPKTLVGDGWVGFSADTAYYAITLKTAASLNFTVNSNDAVKFTVSSLTPQNKLKSLQKFTVKPKNGAVTTASSKKSLLVAAGTYYISMVSTNAKKGGNASYSVGINNLSVFFPKGDNSNDTWQAASLKAPAALGDTLNGWVGFGDAADYYKFTVTKTGSVAVNLNQATAQAVEARQLKLSLLDASGKKVASIAYDSSTFASRQAVTAGTYYLGITCGNVRKYNTSYGVTLGMLA